MCPVETRKSNQYACNGAFYLALFIRYKINEIMTLNKMLVVIGRNILKLPLSITISPGNLPGNGNFGAKCMMRPTTKRIIPAMIKNFPIFKTIKQGLDAWVTAEICF